MIIKVDNVVVEPQSGLYSIKISFEVTGGSNWFVSHEFISRYSCDLEGVPYGIAIIPFVCNVLPIVWLTDGVLVCEELDCDFYQSINDFKRGYQEIYPGLSFGGKIECRPVRYKGERGRGHSLVFFSGGVDAFATLFAHIRECPFLFTVCGADIPLDNKTGWSAVEKQIKDTCDKLSLSSIQCYSNFRVFINENSLCKMVQTMGAREDWWHGFQHGIGLIGHSAPVAYKYGVTNNYIASTYTIRERPFATCASDPRIDSFVRFCDSTVVHDQFEYNRQEKLSHIVEFCRQQNIKVYLRVCWLDADGRNCCRCEKCYRTAAGLMAEGVNPADFGFELIDAKRMEYELKYKMSVPLHCITFWQDTQEAMIRNGANLPEIEWLKLYDTEKLHRNNIKRATRMIHRVKRVVRSFLGKF